MTKPIMEILAPISLGELIDKITILQIKTRNLQGKARRNSMTELEGLENILGSLTIIIDQKLTEQLLKVNEELWEIEDDIREEERKKEFRQNFIELARKVYIKNDLRAAIKKEINIKYGSTLIEEKSYKNY